MCVRLAPDAASPPSAAYSSLAPVLGRWKYSAYHHIDAKARYPPLLMTTSTRDDRVHPYHARAFVKRLQETGHGRTTTYYENIEGGHGGAADPKQQAFMLALYFEFVKRTVGATLGRDQA